MLAQCTDPVFNGLILAINCYVSTSDEVGMGVAGFFTPGVLSVLVARNPDNVVDVVDFDKFGQRVAEVARSTGLWMSLHRDLDFADGSCLGFDAYLFEVGIEDVRVVSRELARSSGLGGWGSYKKLIDGDQRLSMLVAKIASGEGI